LGGHDLLEKIQQALQDHVVGDRIDLHLEPEEAFGDFDELPTIILLEIEEEDLPLGDDFFRMQRRVRRTPFIFKFCVPHADNLRCLTIRC
jgi:FKBP-type peptidyl-prolyl cis-trans isomerase 2